MHLLNATELYTWKWLKWLYFFFCFCFCLGLTHGTWKFLGQGSNPHHSYNRAKSIGNARSLTCRAKRDLWKSEKFHQNKKTSIEGVPWWLGRFRIQYCHGCGSDLIPGPGTSHTISRGKKNMTQEFLLWGNGLRIRLQLLRSLWRCDGLKN